MESREKQLGRLGMRTISISRRLKCNGVKFFLKYPTKCSGKWKFIDIFVPLVQGGFAIIVKQKGMSQASKVEAINKNFECMELMYNAPEMESLIEYLLEAQGKTFFGNWIG
jgi:hypothetical protein